MGSMKREEWQDLAGDVEWTFKYVDDDAVFPEWQSGTGKVPREAWAVWEEPYKVTYGEYVATQREKETAAYAVKAALQRSSVSASLDEGWKSNAKFHYGATALAEYVAVLAESRMARFGLAPRWRNMAIFGVLDEIRHTQTALYFAHEFVGKDPQFDWAHKAYHTNDWAIIAARSFFDGLMMSPNVVDLALQLPLTFESGFTNLQFVGLATDALAAGDVNFANLISSIQTDEARHAQQGGPTLQILAKHDPIRAQWVVDKAFWMSARVFAIITGPCMDYYTPLAHRKHSYKEFMQEWVIAQYVRMLQEHGLKKPWYWDEFIEGLDVWHHALHLGVWFWRPTVWWNPQAGVSKSERLWLQSKYPVWEELYGPIWDTIIENINAGKIEDTLPATLPWLCNLCQLPISTMSQSASGKWSVKDFSLDHNDYTYHFCSKVCRQIWWEDRDSMHLETVTERFLSGRVQPQDVPGVLAWMGITPEVAGNDAYAYRWAKDYAPRRSGNPRGA
jgi:toluene monooxygenase system protein A